MSLSKRLRDLREDHDLTQADIASLLHTTQQQVSRWECGTQTISIEYCIRLAKYYRVSVDYLLGLTNSPNTLTD